MRSNQEVYAHIGKRLKQLRQGQNLTQAQVAGIVGVSPQQYQKYEDAQSKSSVAMLIALSSYYGVPYESFLPDWDGSAPDTDPQTSLPDGASRIGSANAEQTSGPHEDPMVGRLVAAYLQIPDQDERTRLVELVEAMMKAHTR